MKKLAIIIAALVMSLLASCNTAQPATVVPGVGAVAEFETCVDTNVSFRKRCLVNAGIGISDPSQAQLALDQINSGKSINIPDAFYFSMTGVTVEFNQKLGNGKYQLFEVTQICTEEICAQGGSPIKMIFKFE